MKVKIFYLERDNKIVFTPEELEKLLNEVYEEGKQNSNSDTHWWYSSQSGPSVTYSNVPVCDDSQIKI